MPSMQSVYTSLAPSACRLKGVDREAGASVQVCPGIRGYKLLLLDADDRMSITVVTPDKREHPLDFSRVVTPHFSSLSGKAEWRVGKQGNSTAPMGLIVTLTVVDDLASNEDGQMVKASAYKVVVRLADDTICVVDKLSAGPKAEDHARREADASREKSCLRE